MLGARFDGHPWTQDFAIDVVDDDHPATAHLGERWQWHDEVYLFARPATRRPGAAPPGRGPGRPVGARRPGARLRLPPRLVRARTAPPAPSTARWATSPEPGRRRPTCATWPEASPGCARAPNLTPMSGSSGGSDVASLPDVMAAAVYQSPGVGHRGGAPGPTPGTGPGRRARARLRHLRVRHPPAARRLGLQAGCRRRPRMERHRSPPSATTSPDWSVGELVVGRRLAQVRHLPALPRGQALAVREPAAA